MKRFYLSLLLLAVVLSGCKPDPADTDPTDFFAYKAIVQDDSTTGEAQPLQKSFAVEQPLTLSSFSASSEAGADPFAFDHVSNRYGTMLEIHFNQTLDWSISTMDLAVERYNDAESSWTPVVSWDGEFPDGGSDNYMIAWHGGSISQGSWYKIHYRGGAYDVYGTEAPAKSLCWDFNSGVDPGPCDVPDYDPFPVAPLSILGEFARAYQNAQETGASSLGDLILHAIIPTEPEPTVVSITIEYFNNRLKTHSWRELFDNFLGWPDNSDPADPRWDEETLWYWGDIADYNWFILNSEKDQ